MTKNIETKTIYQKLLEAQREIGAIKKDKENPFFKSNYADINNYIEEVKPILNKLGLIILQPLIVKGKGTAIETLIIDTETKDQISSIVKLPDNTNPQQMGSTITYFRRYAIQSLLFLQAEDDDANASKPKTIKKDGVEYKDETPVSKPIKKGLPTIEVEKTPF